MKIIKAEFIPLRVKGTSPLRISKGTTQVVQSVILKLESDDGLVGLSEAVSCPPGYPEELQEGMVIAVETQWPTGEITGQYPYGQCLRIEEEVVITKNGCEVLSQWPIDEITVCW